MRQATRQGMRSAVLAMAVTVAITTGCARAGAQAGAQARKPLPPDVGAGRVAWFDITTSNLARSREFYGALFGWTFAPLQGTDQAVEIVAGGSGIGTLRGAEGTISAANGVVYIQVADLRASARRATELGATLVPGFPFDLSDGTGAIALLTDPAGHPLGMYSRTPLAPVRPPAR